MFSFSKEFSLNNDFEIELLVVGNIITDDLNRGLMKNSEEKTTEAISAANVAIRIGLRFFQRNINRFVESNRLPGCVDSISGLNSYLMFARKSSIFSAFALLTHI
jgi:hypothetical protein